MFKRNIFEDIKRLIFNEEDFLDIRNEHKNAIITFLEKKDHESASNLFNFIKVIHQKETIFDLM